MRTGEPSVAHYAGRPLALYIAATRPAFLAASAVPALIGLASAYHNGVSIEFLSALMTVLGAVLAHAAINVLNDFYDARNGTDALNTERLYPFTGGSRFIQNGVLSNRQTGWFGGALMLATMLVGLLLLVQSGPGLLVIGGVGLLIGWAYSAPPLALNSRGFGEFCVAVGFGLLIPLGADYVQRSGFTALPLYAGLSFALLALDLLYINQFPDYRADLAVGKAHWVVRLGPRRARWGYLMTVLLAYAALVGLIGLGWLPVWCMLGLLTLPASLHASLALLRYAEQPQRLGPAIRSTVLALLAHGLLVSLGLILAT